VDGDTVRGDEGKLKQVLINLLGNAVKFTERGRVRLGVRRDDDGVFFEVVDDGPGIAADRLEAVFEPFHQEEAGRKHVGTGLGLTIARRQVELMGGALRLESTPGSGCRFHFSVPLPAVAGAPAQQTAVDRWDNARPAAGGRRVTALVVDDVATNRDILEGMLRRVGVEAVPAASVADALRLAGERPPDIVLTDIRMPDEGGVELFQRFRQTFGPSGPPIVAVTTSVFMQHRQKILDVGFHGFLEKPVRLGELYRCLSEQVGLAFEFPGSPPQAGAPPTAIDDGHEDVVLSTEMLDGLERAAQSSSITEIRAPDRPALGGGAEGNPALRAPP
jgi:CheY-like chemotaxis protein/anti-sigma regulatory factor (Ser/Thr protein kinase)